MTPRATQCAVVRTLEGTPMATKRKPRTDTTATAPTAPTDAREQLRRALQTSMDTRQ
ncbi:hypothetical protein AB0C02_10740 [Micromonospora sp. NPDC048999]|uniref:hypothetical protein n=1 Tax=Micromonospora sp. NPDC048999 TaxID=3155391 RepID=UPI0033C7EA19